MDGRLSLSMVYPTGGKEAVESAYKLLVKGEELEKNSPSHRPSPRNRAGNLRPHGRPISA
jgi:hypothetical protein